MRMTAFTKYDRMAASTRQRLLQYLPYLEREGIQVDYRPLLGDDYVRALGGGKSPSRFSIIRAYAHRMAELIRGPDADVVWVYAELFPYLPGWFERLALRSGKPVVYDFDDAIFQPYDDNPNPLKRAVLGGKLAPLLRGAALCLCGNRYLEAYAAQYCARTLIMPTVVDTDIYRPAESRPERPVTIGWIGSPTTWPYVAAMLPVLERVAERHGARVRIVGAGAAAASDSPLVDFVDWDEAAEVAEVQRMDIGVMPLPDEDWARGKCGYKLIQYMACGLPVIASPVGVNSEIVGEGVNGLLASTPDEWEEALTALIADPDKARAMGEAGRERVVADYSLATHGPRFAAAIKNVGDQSNKSAAAKDGAA